VGADGFLGCTHDGRPSCLFLHYSEAEKRRLSLDEKNHGE